MLQKITSLAVIFVCVAWNVAVATEWTKHFLEVPYMEIEKAPGFCIEILHNGATGFHRNVSTVGLPLRIGEARYEHGLGMHAPGHIRIHSPQKIVRLVSWIGIDHQYGREKAGSVEFHVQIPGSQPVFQKFVADNSVRAEKLDVKFEATNQLDLIVTDGGDGISCDHADWGEAVIYLEDGTVCRLGDLPYTLIAEPVTKYPFCFTYGGQKSDELLPQWDKSVSVETPDADRVKTVTRWTDPTTALCVEWIVVQYKDFPAVESLLYFENTGSKDSLILENVQAMSLSLASPMTSEEPYLLYRTNGAQSTPKDFKFGKEIIHPEKPRALQAEGGCSSYGDFPFFKIDYSQGAFIAAVGWSGQWKTSFVCQPDGRLDMTAGLEKTRFKLFPKEKVRSPRMLMLNYQGQDTWESNAQFRQLIYKHYAAKRSGRPYLPTPFCNTCFTRGGGWLNETTAENQISLIRAYADIGVKTIITDAGWFTGGWPDGAGNWTPDPEKYPDGMKPVAQAALECGGVYGLWFEPERVVAGTPIHKEHPQWLLSAHDGPNGTYLFNMGIPEAREYFFGIVKEYMDLPGFDVYRQDFNINTLPFWTYSDAPDRQGITEMKYVEGLYHYWDMIAKNSPDSFREQCSGGGRRIDLETVMRMHSHQDSDYWFRWETDQNQIWGMSQYLPNSVFVSHLHNYRPDKGFTVDGFDDYAFCSNMAASLCLGWFADDPEFDKVTAKEYIDRYLSYRELFVGAWYPFLESSMEGNCWMGAQYYRSDLKKGIIIVHRRENSPYAALDVKFHGLKADATYRITEEKSQNSQRFSGAELMKGFRVAIEDTPGSAIYLYMEVSP